MFLPGTLLGLCDRVSPCWGEELCLTGTVVKNVTVVLFRGEATLDLRGISLLAGPFWADRVMSGTRELEEGDEEPGGVWVTIVGVILFRVPSADMVCEGCPLA